MILEKKGRRGLNAKGFQYGSQVKNHSPLYSYWYYQSPRLHKGHVSTAAVFSEYKSYEWLIRETYKKAGCLRMGAKLLQFFETPKYFAIYLRTHTNFRV